MSVAVADVEADTLDFILAILVNRSDQRRANLPVFWVMTFALQEFMGRSR